MCINLRIMNVILHLVFIGILINTSYADRAGWRIFNDDEVERGNEYVDKILQDMVEENGHEYDPYDSPDHVISFWKKVMFVNVSGEAKLHQGYIRGLKTLHRADHCYLNEENGKLIVRADLGAGVINLNYAGTVKFMNFGPTITVHGEINYIEVNMKMKVDAETGRDGELEEFYLEDMRGMKVWITGLGPVNWAVNTLISAVTKIFKGYVKGAIENQIRKHIAERIGNYQFPVDGNNLKTTKEEATTLETFTEITTTEETTVEETTTTEETTVEETTTTEETTVEETTTPEEETTTEEITTEEETTTEEPTTEEETTTEEITTEEETTTEEITTEEETESPETTTITVEETTLEETTPEETTVEQTSSDEETTLPDDVEEPEE